MKKIITVVLPFIFLIGCIDRETEIMEENTAKNESVKPQIIKQVNIHDDSAIIKSAERDVIKITDSTDSENEPKKIYQFDESIIGTQIELSKNELIVGWSNLSEDQTAIDQSKKNRDTVIKTVSAIIGYDASDVIDQIESGNFSPNSIQNVKSGSCIGGMCLIKFSR